MDIIVELDFFFNPKASFEIKDIQFSSIIKFLES